jgi:type I restriction enzyme S subunit
MAGEWKIVKLGELYDVSSGLSKEAKEFGFGSPFLSFKTVFNNYYIPTIIEDKANTTDEEQERCSVQRGDVFLTRTSETLDELGMSCVALKDYPNATFNGFTKRLRPRNVDTIYPLFAVYYFRSKIFRTHIDSMATMTTRASLNNDMIARLPIIIPPYEAQRRIGDTLYALDDKIELNRRMNKTLEEMTRALFKSWFIDFDPVVAKSEGRQPEGMDAATAKLFPSSFEGSEQGPIPKGWKVCTLGDIAKNVSITFNFKRIPEVVFINTGDVLEGDFLHSKRSLHAGLPGQAKKSIRPDDILFSEIRPANQRYAYVDFDSSNYVVSTKFMIIRGSKEIHPRLLYRILTAKETLDEFQVQAESRSGTFPQITFDSISHLPIVLPPIQIQEVYQQAVGKMDAQIKVNKHQSRTLATLRDTLLPKLLSGELGVDKNSN